MEQKTTLPSATTPATEEIIVLNQRAAFHQLMRECYECQQEVDAHWQFCAHCGTRLATRCPGCGNPLPPAGANACFHCGLKIPQIRPTEQ